MTGPTIVDPEEWQSARADLLTAEKEATRALDALAARRRRLPMTPFPATAHTFAGPDGPRTLLDLFGPHRQLVTYQFMDLGPDVYCSGCTWFSDNVPAHAPELLAENGVSWVTVTDMPLDRFAAYRERKNWTMPFVSSRGTSFSADTGAGPRRSRRACSPRTGSPRRSDAGAEPHRGSPATRSEVAATISRWAVSRSTVGTPSPACGP